MAREHEKQKTKESNSEDSTMTDNVLAAARLILDGIAKAGPGIGTVPFLQPAAQATLSIAEAINTVRDNKEDLQELVQDAERVILAIYSTYETSEDKNAWPGQGLEDVLKKLISTLQEINCLAKRRANRNVARRL